MSGAVTSDASRAGGVAEESLLRAEEREMKVRVLEIVIVGVLTFSLAVSRLHQLAEGALEVQARRFSRCRASLLGFGRPVFLEVEKADPEEMHRKRACRLEPLESMALPEPLTIRVEALEDGSCPTGALLLSRCVAALVLECATLLAEDGPDGLGAFILEVKHHAGISDRHLAVEHGQDEGLALLVAHSGVGALLWFRRTMLGHLC